MQHKIEIVPDIEDPLLLRFFLDGRECLNNTYLEIRSRDGLWIPCSFYYEQGVPYEDYSVKEPYVLIWLSSHDETFTAGTIAAQVQGDPLDGLYRWTTPDGGGTA